MRFRFFGNAVKVLIAGTFILSTGCSSGGEAIVECYSTVQFRKFSTPSFSTYLMNVKSGSESRIDTYIQIPYNHLRFEKTKEGFKALYSLLFIIRDGNDEIVQTKEIDRTIMSKAYEETVSSRYDFHLQTFVIPPNSYTMEIVSTDNLSHLRYTFRKKFTVNDYTDSTVNASSILFLDTMTADEKGISLRPIMPASISQLHDSVGMFQELYGIRTNDTVTISEQYSLPFAKPGNDRSYSYLIPPYRITDDACAEQFDSVYYRKDSTFISTKNGTVQLFQFYPLPDIGNTKLDRTISVNRDGRRDSLLYTQKIFRRDHRYYSSLSFEEVTSAMRFILREQEYDSLMAVDGDERNKRINLFWEQRGGMDRRKEYERKIVEANSLFTTCMDGCRTPMGIVYIICGVPDYIDCRGTFNESWFYNIGNRTFSIQFRQENAESHYYEIIPFSVNESVWQYFIDQWRRKR